MACTIASVAFGQDTLKTLQLEEVAIAAVRAPQSAPVAKTDISSRQIEEVYVGQHPIFVLEKLTPGFYSFSESGTSFANYGQFRLRGINQERINITLNSVPLNDMIDQGVFFSNFTDITSNFERIQIQRGVGTSSNGVSSYGGSINFETLNLQGKEAFSSLQLGAGSFDTYRGHFQHFSGINEKGWGFANSFARLASNGYRDHTDTKASSFFLSGGHFADRQVVKFTLFTARSRNGLGYNPIAQSILDENPTFNNLTPNDQDDFSQHMVQWQYNRFVTDQWSLGITGYYGGAGGDYFVDLLSLDSTILNVPLTNDHYGGILNANYRSTNFSVHAGIHAYTFDRENREELLPDRTNPYYLEQSNKREISGFGKATYITGDWTFYGDVQLRSIQLEVQPDYSFIGIAPQGNLTYHWTFLNPRVGVVYDLSDYTSLYASYGKSGREPTKIDLFGGFQLNSVNYHSVRADTSFTEEYVHDVELGFRLSKNHLSIDANTYFMQFENEIAPIGKVLDFGLLQRRNIPTSTRSGVELQWAYIPIQTVEFYGNIAYLMTQVKNVQLDTVEFTNVEHILSPDFIANVQIKVQANEMLSFGISGRYLGEQFMSLSNDKKLMVPSSFVSDFMFEAKPSTVIRVLGGINNVLDNKYYTYGSPVAVSETVTEPGFYAQPERNFFLSLKLTF